MGCGETLFVGEGGYVTCSFSECPHPTAMFEVMDESETEHVVKVDAEGFSIQHPLRERLNGELFDCRLHAWMRKQGGPPVRPGRYRASEQEGDPVAPWFFEPV